MAHAVNRMLKPLGVKLQSLNTVRRLEAQARYSQDRQMAEVYAVNDLTSCFSEFVFPDLAPRENRAELMLKLHGTGCLEALYIAEYLRRTSGAKGDVCEFGVAQGATSALIANEICHTDKLLWLFDSFQGLPRPTEKDKLLDDYLKLGSIDAYAGTMAYPPDDVRVRLEALSFPLVRTRIIPGFIEETIRGSQLPEQVCFAYVDFDFYQPITIALNFLSNHLSPGGAIIVDDYGTFSSGAQSAVDEFVARHSDRFGMALPLSWTRTGKPADRFAIVTRKS